MDPNIVLPFTVNTCTGYHDKDRPSYKQVQDLAVDVTPAPLKPVGFNVGAQEPIGVRTRVNVDLNENDDDETIRRWRRQPLLHSGDRRRQAEEQVRFLP